MTGAGRTFPRESSPMSTIARHRTAMSRTFLSRPMQQALADRIIDVGTTVFDYGCGRGTDLRHLRQLGHTASGWDPAHAPTETHVPADVVNLGYVVNVIEDRHERVETLQAAWKLAREVLVVAGRLDWESRAVEGKPYKDGVMTRAGTFQKFFAQDELRAWIDATLNVRSVAAAPGIFYVFRSPTRAQQLLAQQTRTPDRPHLAIAEIIYQQQVAILAPLEAWVQEHRALPTPADLTVSTELVQEFGSIRAAFALIRRVSSPSLWSDVDLGNRRSSDKRFETNLEILQPLIDFLTERGRLPRPSELDEADAIEKEFGSIRAAFSLVRRVTGADRWQEFELRASEDFLVYLALAAFGGRPKYSELPPDLQFDAKDFFGSYTRACEEANKLLFAVGNLESIEAACRTAPFGKLTPEALYVHIAGLNQLPPILRVYEGCGRALTGEVEGTTLVKMHRLKPQVSFLVYPDFDRQPHPQLHASVVARLGQLAVTYRDFSERANPPILHRKETFVPNGYPGREKFARLTAQEERAALLNKTSIGTQHEWALALSEAGYRLQGHRLTRTPDRAITT